MKEQLKIVEGVESVWFYHLSETGDNGKPALCGNDRMMCTGFPLDTWGMKTHIGEKYCPECERLAVERKQLPPVRMVHRKCQ